MDLLFTLTVQATNHTHLSTENPHGLAELGMKQQTMRSNMK